MNGPTNPAPRHPRATVGPTAATSDEPVRGRGPRRRIAAEINVTPMVDVMLVLLIIFMVAGPAIVTGFDVRLPEGEHLRGRAAGEDRVTLGIDEHGAYYLNARPIAREDAPRLIAAAFRDRPGEAVLFLKADRRLRYREVEAAMMIARRAGAHTIAAVAEQRDDER